MSPKQFSSARFRATLAHTVLAAITLALALTPALALAGPFTQNSIQPGELKDKLEAPGVCAGCHVEPLRDWSGTMMGNDFREPSFLAMLSIAEQDEPGVGDFCLRCHGAGWFEGKSEPPSGDFFGKTFEPPPKIDQESIPICDLCHRMERVGMRRSRFDGAMIAEGNGSVFIRPDDPWKGGKHPLTPLHKTGEFCGACHDVTNPKVPNTNRSGYLHPLERTYTEWKYSYFGENGLTCQQCHPPMKFPGAQTWLLYPGLAKLYPDVDAGWTNAGFALPKDRTSVWQAARERNEAFMKRAADIKVTAPRNVAPGNEAKIKVTVVNNTGHRLPTGFAEGRHMWIYVRVTDAAGKVIFEDGRLDKNGTVVQTDQTKVYEQKAGRGSEESFHFAANDTIIKDNRIPPAGFKKKAYEAEGAFIIGADYRDGQNRDDTIYRFEAPAQTAGPLRATAELRYETYSSEYMEWLRQTDHTLAANHGGPAAATPDGSKTWGETTYKIWETEAKGQPVEMAGDAAEIAVAAESSLLPDYAVPGAAAALFLVLIALGWSRLPRKD